MVFHLSLLYAWSKQMVFLRLDIDEEIDGNRRWGIFTPRFYIITQTCNRLGWLTVI